VKNGFLWVENGLSWVKNGFAWVKNGTTKVIHRGYPQARPGNGFPLLCPLTVFVVGEERFFTTKMNCQK
jgi:hypothetical protein